MARVVPPVADLQCPIEQGGVQHAFGLLVGDVLADRTVDVDQEVLLPLGQLRADLLAILVGVVEQVHTVKVGHNFPALISSTTAGSSRVVVSPRLPISPSATFRRMRRMIFPLRVLGRPLTNWILSGLAMGP